MVKKKKDEPGEAEAAVIEDLLALEIPARQAADSYPDGPNVDAVKSALRNASHGIAHIRKALDANRRVER